MSLKPVGWLGQDADQHDHCYPIHKTIEASPDVLAEGFRVVRVGDAVAPHSGSCSKHRTPHGAEVHKGSTSVFANGKPLAREGDLVKCYTGQTAPLLRGRTTVLVGGGALSATTAVSMPAPAKPEQIGATSVANSGAGAAPPGARPTIVAGDATTTGGIGTGLSLVGVPQTITLSREINNASQKAWQQSFPNKKPIEQGFVVMEDEATGKVSVFYGRAADRGVLSLLSTSGTFVPDRQVPDGKEIRGVWHTHPSDTPASLSGGDGAYVVLNGDDFIGAQSGKMQYLFLRTPNTVASVDFKQVNDYANQLIGEYMREGLSYTEATEKSSAKVAELLGLAFYKGTDGKLSRVYP